MDSPLGSCLAMYAFPTLGELYRALDRVYKLGVSLPDAPLDALTKATAHRIQLEHGIFASVAGERVVCVE